MMHPSGRRSRPAETRPMPCHRQQIAPSSFSTESTNPYRGENGASASPRRSEQQSAARTYRDPHRQVPRCAADRYLARSSARRAAEHLTSSWTVVRLPVFVGIVSIGAILAFVHRVRRAAPLSPGITDDRRHTKLQTRRSEASAVISAPDKLRPSRPPRYCAI